MTIDDYLRAKIVDFAWTRGAGVSTNLCVAIMYILRTWAGEDKNWMRGLNSELASAPPTALPADPRNPEFRKLLDYVDGIYSEDSVDKWTNGARYWLLPEDSSRWFDLAGKERVGQLGTVTFWK